MASTAEMIFKITADTKAVKSELAQLRSELTQVAQTQKATNQGELSMKQQLAAAASLQRQRSAALISQWKQQERAATQLATGIRPVSTNLQQITNTMQTLAGASATLQGPLGSVAGRLSSIGTLASEARGALGLVGVAVGVLAVASVAAAVGLVAISVAAGKAIFDLAKSASTAGSEIFDLSKKTNFSTETLSALRIEAEQSNGSIESVAASLSIFQANMVKASEGNKDLAKTFKDLKIDTKDQETAFRQAAKALFEMGETEQQSAKAKQLFGKSAKDVLGIIKATNGDIDASIEKWDKLGLVIGGPAAAAADAFGDQLDILERQFVGLGRTIGFSVLPVLTVFFEDLSKGLTGSRGDWEEWGKHVERIIAGTLGAAQGLARYIASGFRLDLLQQVELASQDLFRRAQEQRTVLTAIAVAEQAARQMLGARDRPAAAPAKAKDSGTSELEQELKKQLDAFNKLTTELGLVVDAYEGLDTQTREYTVTQSILNGALSKASEWMQKEALYAAVNIDKIKQQIAAKKELAEFQNKINSQIKVAQEGTTGFLGQAQQLIAKLEAQGVVLTKSEKDWIQLNAGLLGAIELGKQLPAIWDKMAESFGALDLSGIENLSADAIASLAGDAANKAAGTPPVMSPVPAEVIESWAILKGTALDALGGMAQGIGSLVEQWVLYGNVGPNALRKMVASVLAAAAAQAIVESIMQLAHAWKEAALASASAAAFDFRGAALHSAASAAHLTAAGVYALVGGAAAVGGRIAASGIMQEGGQTTGASSSGTARGGASTADQKPVGFDVNRRNLGGGSNANIDSNAIANAIQRGLEGMQINVGVRGEASEGFRYLVENVAVQSVRLNGPFRKIQTGEDV